jgi:hypothetical protein
MDNMGETCSTHEKGDKFMQSLVRKPEDNRPNKKQRRWEYNTYYKKFWEEIVAYFPMIRDGTHRKRLSSLYVIYTRRRKEIVDLMRSQG